MWLTTEPVYVSSSSMLNLMKGGLEVLWYLPALKWRTKVKR